jgi:hypothetical protein
MTVNNFDFDFLILVNVDDEYRIQGMWRLPVARAKDLFRESSRLSEAPSHAEPLQA